MSLQNLNKKNNYEFFCKKITVDEYEIDTITVDNINVNTATVLTEVTTPHINSGTSLFNTVVTSSLDAANGIILDLNSNAIECDNLTVNNTTISPTVRVDSLATTSGSGNITSSNPITCANVNTNVINSTSGGGFINVLRPIVLPNITNSSALAYYSYNTLTLTTTGCIAMTLTGFGVRVGNMITVYVQCLPNTTLATSLGVLFINGFPSQYAPNVGSTRGTCLVNSLAGAVFGSYTFTSSGQLNIFSGPNGGGWNVGQPCGLASTAVVGSDYASFSLITNI